MSNLLHLSGRKPKVIEFFAGIGLARSGLERAGFEVVWANDYEQSKYDLYVRQYGDPQAQGNHYVVDDIANITADALPVDAALAWASSPCTDLSLAGSRRGIRSGESNAFWQFIRILDELRENRPEVVVLENVVGLATSHAGDDIAAAIRAFNELGYSVDVMAIDARRFVPQSRPRLFLVGALNPPVCGLNQEHELRPEWLQSIFSDSTLRTHRATLPCAPPLLTEGFGDYVEEMPDDDARWWNEERMQAFMLSLSSVQMQRIREMRSTPGVKYRTAYRRTRNRVPVWEVRADDISGCLRTARGGSSKQAVVKIENKKIKVRWMTPSEYSRLMGVDDFDFHGVRANQALFGFGDAVVVPAVQWLAENYLMPLVRGSIIASDIEGRTRIG